MIVSNIAAPMLGLVDTAIIGHLPNSIYLSAVALGAMVVSFIYLLAVFLRMTTTAEMAAAFGADDRRAQRSITYHALIIALLLGGVIIALRPWLTEFAWWLIEPQANLLTLASDYIEIRLWAAPAALINLVILGVILARQRARQAMFLVIFTNAVNVIADIIFIIGLDLNVAGAAYASVLAEISTAMLGLWLIRQQLPRRSELRLEQAHLTRFIGMNRDVFIRSLALQLCMATMTGYAVAFGTVVVAANAVLMQFLMLISLGLDGVAYAVEALVGAARGKQSRQLERHWMRLTLIWSLLFACCYSLIFWWAGDWIIAQITDLTDVRAVAQQFLPWLYLLPLLAHWSYFYDGVYIGLGWTTGMRNTMLFSALFGFVPVVLLSQMLLTEKNANHGLWLALVCFLSTRGLSQWWLLRRRLLS